MVTIHISRAFTALVCGFMLLAGSAVTSTAVAEAAVMTHSGHSAKLMSRDARSAAMRPEQVRHMRSMVKRYQAAVFHWQDLSVTPRSTSHQFKDWMKDPQRLQRMVKLWHGRLKHARSVAKHPPNLSSWLCIHQHEENPAQGWQTNTGNGYFGGLQMNMTFIKQFAMRLYQKFGTADKWPWFTQVWVAEHVRAREGGFGRWSTHGYCGLPA